MDTQTKFSMMYPDLGTEPLSLDPYYSQEQFEKEKEKIFKKTWLCVGRENEAAKPGDYFIVDLPIGDTSLIIVRGRDNKIRALHNACTHRCNKVAVDPVAGNTKNFICGFHGWSFGLDGKLNVVPDEGMFFGLDKSKLHLKEVPVDTWEGFVFINLDPNPSMTLKEHLGEIYDIFRGFPHENMVKMLSWTARLNCNWKVLKDAFMEAYHAVELHRRSAPEAFVSEHNPFGHLNSVRLYKRHGAMSIYGNPAQAPSALAQKALAWAMGPSYAAASANAKLPEVPGANPDKRADWSFDSTIIFPNFSFYTANGWFLHMLYWPIGAEECMQEINIYTFEPQTISAFVGWEHTKTQLFDVGLEDLSTVERIQSMLRGGAVKDMMLSDMEALVRHGYQAVKKAIEE